MGIESLPDQLVDDLGAPEAYPDDPTASLGVETLQTHISHLFLTRARVVKLRKAVKLSFLDFSTRADRIADCHHEVALNRRLAPDVYLGVAPVQRVAGHFEVRERWESAPDSLAELPESVVVMRRLETGRDALTLLQRGALLAHHMDVVAELLAGFHDRVGLGCPSPWEPDAWWEHCFRPAADTLATLQETQSSCVSGDAIEALWTATRDRFEELRPALEQRRREGRAVDGHGDVHLQHIWFEQGAPGPVVIDCLEFDPRLRRVDVASEVAFLAMDLLYRGRSDLAARFLRKYATARDDFGLFRIVDAYQSYRAAVRGKVAAIATTDARIPQPQRTSAQESARRHLALATKLIRGHKTGTLVLVCGTVGVGKSTVAETLADRTGGVVVSSDRTRKRIEGIEATDHGDHAPDSGLYTPEKTDAVYRALLDRAEPVVASGRIAILDATFGRRVHRDQAQAWAARHKVNALLVEVRCPEDVVRERVGRRAERGSDPSDAGPEFVAISRSRFEAPTEWQSADRYETRTDREALEDSLLPLVTRLASAS